MGTISKNLNILVVGESKPTRKKVEKAEKVSFLMRDCLIYSWLFLEKIQTKN